jgi:FkbM family methyltransferase
MRRGATDAIKSIAARSGLEIRRARGQEIHVHRQRKILLDTLAVTLVLDVGANVGQYAGIHLREWTGYTGRIESFEPGSSACSECERRARNDPRWSVHSFGLSDEAGTAALNIPQGASDLSSVSAMTTVGERLAEGTVSAREQVTLRRLDDVVHGITQPGDRLALKLDVQGHEAAVLRGGQRALERVVLLECEMPLVAMYEGQETFEGLLGMIVAAGFFPVGMCSNYIDPRTGFAMDADAFFVRRDADSIRR